VFSDAVPCAVSYAMYYSTVLVSPLLEQEDVDENCDDDANDNDAGESQSLVPTTTIIATGHDR
jgi:hypothetical protein